METVVPQQTTNWQGIPYFPISQYYREFFGGKVLKIPVSVPGTCPNREGLNGMEVCNFCDEWGSAAYPDNRDDELIEQIEQNRIKVLRKGKTDKFLIYFQSYTFTFSRVAQLRKYFEACVEMPGVVGFVVGTRPDCLSDAVIDLWNEYSDRLAIFVELGIQSFDDEQLEWMKRGHSRERSIKALYRLQKKCPTINVGIHLMFGLPGEDDQQIIGTAKLCNELPIHNVKLHNLHVLVNTPLADDYKAGKFRPIELDEYCHRVQVFLQHLKPEIAVHRLAANSSREEELLAPKFTAMKMYTYQYMLDFMNDRGAFQGQKLPEAH